MNRFDPSPDFCGASTETVCQPEASAALNMINFIKNTTENMFENQSPIFTFNSWKRGSVVCDYEIKFVQPIRELSIEATGPSPADLFLANLGSAFQVIEFKILTR